MNNEALKAFVYNDRAKIEDEGRKRTEEMFFKVLGVFPDNVDVSKKISLPEDLIIGYSSIYNSGYLCSLDGADFIVLPAYTHGLRYNTYPVLYQRIKVIVRREDKKKLFKKQTYYDDVNYHFKLITRPADIEV